MGTTRRLAAWLLAAVLFGLAPVVASAQSKLFLLKADAATLSGVVVLTITNATPTGNSTINSAIINIDRTAPNDPGWQIQSAASSTGQATVIDASTITVVNMSPVKPGKSFTVSVQLKAGTYACNTSTLWNAQPNTGNSNNGQPFNYILPPQPPGIVTQTDALRTSATQCDGILACNGSIPLLFLGPGVINGQRGMFNKDNSACVDVNYNFINNITVNNSVQLLWDTGSQPNATFTYTAFWNPEWVGANGVPTSVTKVRWGNLASPVPARACVGSALPAPYGTIVSYSGTATSGTLVIFVPNPLTANWAVAPTSTTLSFPVEIGKERLQLTFVSQTAVSGGANYTYSAQRNASWTGSQDLLSAGTSVMSNPLPLDGSGVQMQMCIVDEGYTTVDPSLCPQATVSSPPVACVQKSDQAFDIGDGFMVGN